MPDRNGVEHQGPEAGGLKPQSEDNTTKGKELSQDHCHSRGQAREGLAQRPQVLQSLRGQSEEPHKTRDRGQVLGVLITTAHCLQTVPYLLAQFQENRMAQEQYGSSG